MKYVITIHSNPRPWGHPTSDFLPEHQALPAEQRERLNADFEALLEELSASGELVGGEALADAADARLYRWESGRPVATDGPYSEAREHLAGFFLVDVGDAEGALTDYRQAARLTASLPEQRYLNARAQRLTPVSGRPGR